MTRRGKLTRRVALVEMTRQPAPLGYPVEPNNREQRRRLARALRRTESRKPRRS